MPAYKTSFHRGISLLARDSSTSMKVKYMRKIPVYNNNKCKWEYRIELGMDLKFTLAYIVGTLALIISAWLLFSQ